MVLTVPSSNMTLFLVSISNGCTWVGDKNVLLEPLDQRVLVADLAALVFGMLLGPAVHQRVNQESDSSRGSPYASTCSGVASFLQVTWNVVREAKSSGDNTTYNVGRHGCWWIVLFVSCGLF